MPNDWARVRKTDPNPIGPPYIRYLLYMNIPEGWRCFRQHFDRLVAWFKFGVGCALTVMYLIYWSGYRTAVLDALCGTYAERYREAVVWSKKRWKAGSATASAKASRLLGDSPWRCYPLMTLRREVFRSNGWPPKLGFQIIQCCARFLKVGVEVVLHELQDLANDRVAETIKHFGSSSSLVYKLLATQHGEMLRNIRLLNLQLFYQAAGGKLSILQQLQNGNPGGVRQCLKNVGFETAKRAVHSEPQRRLLHANIRILAEDAMSLDAPIILLHWVNSDEDTDLHPILLHLIGLGSTSLRCSSFSHVEVVGSNPAVPTNPFNNLASPRNVGFVAFCCKSPEP
jgi:hypothetical protein